MSKFNENIGYTDRLRENMEQIPFSIYKHLVEKDKILRGRQKVAVKDIAENIFAGNRASLLWMPTGGGKTVMIARMLEGFHRDAETQRPKRTLFISDSKDGVENTVEKIEEFSDVDATPYYSRDKNLTGEVIVTTYNSWQRDDFPLDPQDIDLVVLDEGHKSLSEARRLELQKYENAIWMSLTATPTYDEERSLLEYYALGHRTTIAEAVEFGLISSFRNIVASTGVDVNLDDVGVNSNGEFSEKALSREINKKARNEAVAKTLLFGTHPDTGEPLRDLHGVIKCSDTDHAKNLSKTLNAEYKKHFPNAPADFILAADIKGAMTDDKKDKLFADHRAGKIGYLCYARLLTHNYDDKTIQVTMNASLTQSDVEIQQSHGRGFRINEKDPTKIALALDFVDKYVGEKGKVPLVYGMSIGKTFVITDEAEKAAVQEKERRRVADGVPSAEQKIIAEFVKDIALKVTVEEKEIFALIKKGDERTIPAKTENDLTRSDLVARGLNVDRIRNTFNKLEKAWDTYRTNKEQGMHDDNNPKPPLEPYKVSLPGSPAANAIDAKDFETFEKLSKSQIYLLKKKTENDLTHIDLKQRGLGTKAISDTFNVLKAAWATYSENKEQGVPDDKNPRPLVEPYEVEFKGAPATAIHPDEFVIFEKMAQGDTPGPEVRNKTKNDLTSADLIARGISRSNVSKGFSVLKKAWGTYEENKLKGLPDKENPKPLVELDVVKPRKGMASSSIQEKDFKTFKILSEGDSYGVREKTNRDLTQADLLNRGLGISQVQAALTFLEEAQVTYEKNKSKGVPDKKNPKPPIDSYKVKTSSGSPSKAISESNFDAFVQFIKNKDHLEGKIGKKKPKHDPNVPS